MAIRGGYQPHILRVDIDQGTIEKEVPQLAKATDSEAPLIFMLGPLSGTPVVNSSDV